MNKVTISNPTGDHEEILERLAKSLGRSEQRIAVFKEIYRGQKRSKTAAEIAAATGLTELRVLQRGGELVDRHLANAEQKGSPPRRAFAKDSTVKPLRDKILGLVENPEKIKKIPTKRKTAERPAKTVIISREPRKGKSTQTVRVLYLTASGERSPLRVDAEVRGVQEQLRGARFGDQMSFAIRPAAGAKTLVDGLNDLRPHLVHFSGHAGQDGAVLDEGEITNRAVQFIEFDLLRDILAATDSPPKVLVLNACDTAGSADKFLNVIDHVVAMSSSVSDLAAATFAAAFYAALAGGQPLDKAVEQGKNALRIIGSVDAQLPTLKSKVAGSANRFRFF